MSKRYVIVVDEEVEDYLEEEWATEDVTVQEVLTQLLYAEAGVPMPATPAERRRQATLAKRKKKLAEDEAALMVKREVPANPLDKRKSTKAPLPTPEESKPVQSVQPSKPVQESKPIATPPRGNNVFAKR